MIEQLKKVFAVQELRTRLLYTLMMLAIYRVGAHIPLPGVDPGALQQFMNDLTKSGGASSALDYLDMFSGKALSQMAIFAMGIMPYISASIILQLLTVVVPTLERLSKEGEAGRRKITTWTRYLTLGIAIIQAIGISWWLTSAQARTSGGEPIVPHPGPLFWFTSVLTLATGTVFIMWLGEQISERGIGNGISLIIFSSIAVRLVPAVVQTWEMVQRGDMINGLQAVLLMAVSVGMVAFIVFMERAQRRIPVQYAKRVVGRQVRAGQSTHLPLKLNTSGVIPVIFAQSLVVLPTMVLALPKLATYEPAKRLANQLQVGMPLYVLAEIAAIVFFCFFYTSIVFNPVDTTDNIRKFGGFIPGIRPGRKTAEYIDTVLSRITFWGALYLAAVTLIPTFLLYGIRLDELPWIFGHAFAGLPTWMKTGLHLPPSTASFFGGTSLLIVVGVAMDFTAQLESQLIMRHYDGFLRGTRLRGRRF